MSAYPGSNKAFSVEHHSIREEQLLQALSLFERRLHPQVRGTRQNALCEGQDALYVEFLEQVGMAVDVEERELLAEFVLVVVVPVDVDRLSKKKGLVESVELLLDCLRPTLKVRDVATDLGLALFPRANDVLSHEPHVTGRRL